jgi:hypothetical protein
VLVTDEVLSAHLTICVSVSVSVSVCVCVCVYVGFIAKRQATSEEPLWLTLSRLPDLTGRRCYVVTPQATSV